MGRLLFAVPLLALLALPVARAAEPGSRVIVSTTLNDTVQFFDASTLQQTQPPLPGKGLGPVRLWVQGFDGRDYLFAANHGVANGSVGVFDLSGDLVTELPLSPFPARAGSVGVVAGEVQVDGQARPMVFVTNTTFALGGCDMPIGSLTAYDASMLGSAGLLIETNTVELSGSIPYAVALADGTDRVFASSNCGDKLDTIQIGPGGVMGMQASLTASRATGAGPDGTIWDPARALNYTVNIGGDSLSVHDLDSPEPVTTVPLPGGAGPIDIALADSPSGASWVISANGGDDTVSVIDRDAIAACVAASVVECSEAYAATLSVSFDGGAPEGVAYDPATNRIFVVEKPIGNPHLTVIQVVEEPALTGSIVAHIPLRALGADTPVPSLIAFDVVVQPRT